MPTIAEIRESRVNRFAPLAARQWGGSESDWRWWAALSREHGCAFGVVSCTCEFCVGANDDSSSVPMVVGNLPYPEGANVRDIGQCLDGRTKKVYRDAKYALSFLRTAGIRKADRAKLRRFAELIQNYDVGTHQTIVEAPNQIIISAGRPAYFAGNEARQLVRDFRVQSLACITCRNTPGGCTCNTCSNAQCGAFSQSHCPDCKRCNGRNCCLCPRCQPCGGMVESLDYCTDCRRCDSHCGCDQRGPISYRGKEDFHDEEDLRNAPNRFVGVELEIASAPRKSRVMKVLRKWGATAKRDGSLPETGAEIVTAPAKGKKALLQLQELCDAFVQEKYSVDNSCGGHVHVDCRDLHTQDIGKIGAFWTIIEPAVLQVVKPSRLGNTFCKKVTYTFDDCMSVTKSGNMDRLSSDRYFALNLSAYRSHKTVEFRLWEGTVDYDLAVLNVRVSDAIVRRAIKFSPQELRDLHKRVVVDKEQSRWDVFQSSMPPDIRKVLNKKRDFGGEL